MISKEQVLHIAKLARLELTEQETEKMQKDLSAILDYFALLQKAPKLSKKEKMISLPVEKVTRKDEVVVKNTNIANTLISAAPSQQDGYIKVKAIL